MTAVAAAAATAAPRPGRGRANVGLSALIKKRARDRVRLAVRTSLLQLVDAMNTFGVADAENMQMFSMQTACVKSLEARLCSGGGGGARGGCGGCGGGGGDGGATAIVHGVCTHDSHTDVFVYYTTEERFGVHSLSALMHSIENLRRGPHSKIVVVHSGHVAQLASECAAEMAYHDPTHTVQFLDVSKTQHGLAAAIGRAVWKGVPATRRHQAGHAAHLQ